MKKYAITGGASSGKSSIIIALEMRGEYVIRESAECVARYLKAKGLENPHSKNIYQPLVLDLFLKREKNILQCNPNRVFYDRGVHDQLDYTLKNGFKIFPKLKEELQKVKYEKVFFIESLNKLQKTDYRREKNLEECTEMGNLHLETYKKYGFDVIEVPNLRLEERVDFILNNCKK